MNWEENLWSNSYIFHYVRPKLTIKSCCRGYREETWETTSTHWPDMLHWQGY